MVNWHSLSTDETLEKLKGSWDGLPLNEVQARFKQYGYNRLPPPQKNSPFVRLLRQFHNVLIYVLLLSSFITAILGHWVDTAVIVGVVMINAIIGFIQEGKAEKALEAIRNMLSGKATVLRNGKREVIPAESLVPGDLVFLHSGDKVPADLRLYQSKDLRIDESALTGESVPVEKNISPVSPDTLLGDRLSMGFSGTLVTYGQGRGLVVGTGSDTEIGRINTLIRKVQPLTTPLLVQMARFGKWLSFAVLAFSSLTFGIGVWVHGNDVGEMFLAAVGLSVAAIPEGLPTIVTITLAIGVQRMAKRNAIIRRLPAVETLGSVTVICSDKTGTLTQNEMTVQNIILSEDIIEVTGAGYNPHGGFLKEEKELEPCSHPDLLELGRASILCNDSTLEQHVDTWKGTGDPTEIGLFALGLKMGIDPKLEASQMPRTDSIPFESEHAYMATLHHDHAGNGFIFLKGAPEKILELCNQQRIHGKDTHLNIPFWNRQMEALAQRGQRLLGIGMKMVPNHPSSLTFGNIAGNFSLLGIVGMTDPPRAEAINAVSKCQSAGIRVKMITGDHASTAKIIGSRLGIRTGKSILTGKDLQELTEDQLRDQVKDVDVFARTSPENKLRLVNALQENGEVVAMTGDGVNDAPALKRASVGISMGLKGTEVAKEASEMVLADDNFETITHAVEEGRTVYENIKKSIVFILPTNAAEALMVIVAIVSGKMLPLTPVQILWVNMITAITLALSLAFEPAEKSIMEQPPRDPKEPILTPFLVWRIMFVSIIVLIGAFGLFVWERQNGASIEYARTIATNTLVVFEAFYLLNTRFIRKSVLSKTGLTGNPYVLYSIALVVFMQLTFTYLPFMQTLFETRSISIQDWFRIILISSSVFFLVEIEKKLIPPKVR